MNIDGILKDLGIGVGRRDSIKSVQHGLLTFEQNDVKKNITVNAVDDKKTIVLISSYVSNGNTQNNARYFIADIISPTNIEIERQAISNTTTPIYIAWQLVEFDNIKLLQKGTYTNTEYISGEFAIPIEPVNIEKSIVFHTETTVSENTYNYVLKRVRLRSNNELGIYTLDSTGEVIKWQVVEFN